MSNWVDMLLHGDVNTSLAGPEMILLILLVAFALGHLIGWVYMWTHQGLSYSRMFVASLVVIPSLVALVMTLMAGNIVIAFGLLAVFAVVRFRNVLKDTRDTTFILWAIVMGLAVGTLRFGTALIGCLVVATIFLYLRFTAFGSRQRHHVILTLHWSGAEPPARALRPVLWRHAVRAQLASERAGAQEGADLSYRLQLRDPARSGELLTDLRAVSGVAHASLYAQQDESEV